MPSAAQTFSPAQSTEVCNFAAAQGVGSYLMPVLRLTDRLFPEALRTVVHIEEDPEIANDKHLVIEVDIPSLDAESYAEAKLRWARELFGVCPAPLVCVFRCTLNIVES